MGLLELLSEPKTRANLLLGEVAALLHDVGKCHNDFIKRQLGGNVPYDYEKVVSPQQAIGLKSHLTNLFNNVTTIRDWVINQLPDPLVWGDPAVLAMVSEICSNFPATNSTLTKSRDIREFASLKSVRNELANLTQRYDEELIGKVMGATALYDLWQNDKPGIFTNDDAKQIQAILLKQPINLLKETYQLGEILLLYHGNFLPFDDLQTDCTFLLAPPSIHQQLYALSLLNNCHGSAHVDKDNGNRPQKAFISSAFGATVDFVNESGNRDLTSIAMHIPFEQLGERSVLVSYLQKHLRFALGDTSLPFNEVTLWDWSWSVAALYKAALAKYQFTALPNWPQPIADLKWNTLRITVDVLGMLTKAHRIPDVLAYSDALQDGFDRVKTLIEETYPLGNEIYRDSTGIYFTFPDCDKSQELLVELQPVIQTIMTGTDFAELRPLVELGKEAWGEHDAQKMLSEVHNAGRAAILGGALGTDIDWQSQWQIGENLEICPVCGMRPMPRKLKEYRQQRCQVCERRANGFKSCWQAGKKMRPDDNERETIWLDEIADEHDRVALIVGRFQLDTWLNGSMISTLLGTSPDKGAHLKEASPSRIHRVWRTTQEFWEWASYMIADTYTAKQEALRCQRWKFQIDWDKKEYDIRPEDVLDGTLDSVPISLYQHKDGFCTTISNLTLFTDESAFIPRKDGPRVEVRKDNGLWFTGKVIQADRMPLSTPESAPSPLRSYQPTRTILTSPDQFLALVPATDALDITQQIAAQYADDMGKVRSRLPLDLSLVYFHRKMPLYAAIDAARRFLNEPAPAVEKWIVRDDHMVGAMPIHFTNGCSWKIETTFGDGSEDHFYPYVALASGPAASDQMSYTTPDGATFVHVKDLAAWQQIKVAPSHFSYLWLDNSTRRYSIGEREEDVPFSTQQAPLEEIELLTKMWNDFKAAKITDTTLHGVIQLLLEKRMAWKDNTTFIRFALDVLRHNKLYCLLFQPKPEPSEAESLYTIERLFRCFDLHHRIMKVKLAPTNEKEIPAK